MDFSWISEMSAQRKQTPFLNIPDSVSGGIQRTDQDNGIPSLHLPPESESAVRRPRSGTMPTRSSILPYETNSNLLGQTPVTTRHRSESATFPPQVGIGFSARFNSAAPSSDTDPSPLDDGADTIASTLASLGLNDDQPMSCAPPSYPLLSLTPSLDADIDQTNDKSGMANFGTRSRAYTIGTRTPIERPDVSRLLAPSMEFDPFSLDTGPQHLPQRQPQRPRAISVGVADGAGVHSPSQRQRLGGLGSFLVATPSHAAPSLRPSQSNSDQAELFNPFQGFATDLPATEPPPTAHNPATSSSPSSSPTWSAPQIPSRALWLGNINASLNVPDLTHIFSQYGQVESARILSDKECAFVNFVSVESAVAAKTDLETRLGCRLMGTVVRVGFGKADVNQAMANTVDAGPNAQGPTRALWVGNIPANMDKAVLRSIFQPFGAIESVRVLSHKNCGFVNFEYQEDAVLARKKLQNKEILGPGTGAVRIGFARVPTTTSSEDDGEKGDVTPPGSATANLPDTYKATQWAAAFMMSSMMNNNVTHTDLHAAIATERQFIMQQLDPTYKTNTYQDNESRTYMTEIPIVIELGADRKLEPLRLRDIRKKLDAGMGRNDIDSMVDECMEEIVELCNDYMGNTVIQKLYEYANDDTRMRMLQRIAPYLASIGVHKNGTWAAQKIVECTENPEQIELIAHHVETYVPLLLLDQFGNYVVQCCLRKTLQKSSYIVNAIADRCWEIGQGRFGARAVRTILESTFITREQQLFVAAAIVQNAVLLSTNANGVLLLVWLLETSEFAGRYKALLPRLIPYLGKLSAHKHGSMTLFRMVNQSHDSDIRQLMLNAIFNDAALLTQILKDPTHGVGLVQKIISIPQLQQRDHIITKTKQVLNEQPSLQQSPAYKRLLEELNQEAEAEAETELEPEKPLASEPIVSEQPNDQHWTQNQQAMAMVVNMYAAAMTTQQEPLSTTAISDVSKFDQIIKSLLSNNSRPLDRGDKSLNLASLPEEDTT